MTDAHANTDAVGITMITANSHGRGTWAGIRNQVICVPVPVKKPIHNAYQILTLRSFSSILILPTKREANPRRLASLSISYFSLSVFSTGGALRSRLPLRGHGGRA